MDTNIAEEIIKLLKSHSLSEAAACFLESNIELHYYSFTLLDKIIDEIPDKYIKQSLDNT